MVPTWKRHLTTLKTRSQKIRTKVVTIIEERPLLSFFGLLAILLVIIAISNFLRKPPAAAPVAEQAAKPVTVYSSSQAPTLTFSAKIEKSGVINIYAQSGGIVQGIKTKAGSRVSRGSTLVQLSTNYQGGNTSSLSRQIAQKSFEFNKDNFDSQKEIIAKQRELATKGDTQGDELRSITRQSLDETRSLISLNETILSGINAQIAYLESTNVGGANDAAILGAQQGKAGAQAGLNQLRAGLRNAEYQSSETNTPAQMSDISKDVAIKQLDLQERSLTLTRDISELNVKLARVQESQMYPATPCAGVVERVYVKIGQSVSPGTLIATIKADGGENTALALVTRDVAKQISLTEPSVIFIGGKNVSLYPRYISTEATDGSLYSVTYDVPREYATSLTNSELMQIQIPVGSKNISTTSVAVPLDAIYQTQDKAFVSVIHRDGELATAKTVEVTLGEVSGSFVQVVSGLNSDDVVVTSRNVQDGDKVVIQ